MKLPFFVFPLSIAVCASAQTAPAPAPASVPTKIAIIQFQAAVMTTQEGQQAQATLKAKFDPVKAKLEKRQADLQAMQDKLQKGGATLSADARARMEKDISAGGRSLNNDAEDLNNDVQEEQNKIVQPMADKMGAIIRDYATKNGFAVVLDVSSEQTAVLWASPAINITAEIVKLYDQAHPVKAGTTAAPSSGAAKPPAVTSPAPAPPKPAPAKPPASKKQ